MKPPFCELNSCHLSRRQANRLMTASGIVFSAGFARANEPEMLKIVSPLPWQVVQREGYVPAMAHGHALGGARLGQARMTIAGEWLGKTPARLEARAVVKAGCTGTEVAWASLGNLAAEGPFSKVLDLPAGGWYRLEMRAMDSDGRQLAESAVEAVGCGEVFLISGQSYAAGANDEHQKIDDPLGRSVKYDWVQKVWSTASDPFPHVDNGGTIWPAFANMIQPILGVPVGLLNVAVGGTASRQWMPGEALYDRFLKGGQAVGRFRHVLWQQGESDVIENIDTKTYMDRLIQIRSSLCREWGFEPLWLAAKSTIHPTVYNKPTQENQIREAIARLWRQPGFASGPDTDILTGENRGGVKSRRHFSAIGQRRAGSMWFASVWAALTQEKNA